MKKAITFSYDDGIVQDIRLIEIFNKYNLKATFNLNYALLGLDGHLIINEKRINHAKISPDRVKEIYLGHEVASHTLTHPFLPEQEDAVVVHQVEGDRRALSELVGYEVRGFAYPGGGVNCNERLEKLLAENTKVEYARTTVPTYNFDLQSRLHLFNPTCALLKDKGELLSLWERFVSTEVEGIQLFYIWGHTYELDVNDDWQFFEEFCKLISNNPTVYYCTNIEAFDYIKSKNN